MEDTDRGHGWRTRIKHTDGGHESGEHAFEFKLCPYLFMVLHGWRTREWGACVRVCGVQDRGGEQRQEQRRLLARRAAVFGRSTAPLAPQSRILAARRRTVRHSRSFPRPSRRVGRYVTHRTCITRSRCGRAAARAPCAAYSAGWLGAGPVDSAAHTNARVCVCGPGLQRPSQTHACACGVHVCMCACVHVCVCACGVHVCVCACVCMCMCACACLCVCVCGMCVCVCVCCVCVRARA